jgi:uncharacterized RDD family membrane protein YckC
LCQKKEVVYLNKKLILFLKRVLAYFIDYVICASIDILFIYGTKGLIHLIFAMLGVSKLTTNVILPLLNTLGAVILLVPLFLYFPLMESSSLKGTIGKRVLHLILIDTNGNQISFFRAFIRNILKLLSGIIPITYLAVLITVKGRALHDLATGCFVCNANEMIGQTSLLTNANKS